ncbi:MAG: SDR family oxidoreductase, partial [Paracoccaceae bacterium]
MVDLHNKVVVVTGASRGIGAESARVFANAGASVVLLARSRADIAALSTEIGDNALAIPCDIADYADVEAAIATVRRERSQIDVLIN